MNIEIAIEGANIQASLEDNPTAKDFLSLLPLPVTLEDYAATEKITYLPRKLSTQGAPDGYEPRAGDIAYYAPWGNIAIFYKDFRFSPGLVKLGRIAHGLEMLRRPGPTKGTIVLA
jgi:hypothetical protein